MFKKGDRVKIVKKYSSSNYNLSSYRNDIKYGIVEKVDVSPKYNQMTYEKIGDEAIYTLSGFNEEYLGRFSEDQLELTLKPFPKNPNIMKKLSLIAQQLLDKDLRTLVKAGILNEELGVEDTDFVLSFFVTQNKEKLAIQAKKLLKEKKKKCEEDEDED